MLAEDPSLRRRTIDERPDSSLSGPSRRRLGPVAERRHSSLDDTFVTRARHARDVSHGATAPLRRSTMPRASGRRSRSSSSRASSMRGERALRLDRPRLERTPCAYAMQPLHSVICRRTATVVLLKLRCRSIELVSKAVVRVAFGVPRAHRGPGALKSLTLRAIAAPTRELRWRGTYSSWTRALLVSHGAIALRRLRRPCWSQAEIRRERHVGRMTCDTIRVIPRCGIRLLHLRRNQPLSCEARTPRIQMSPVKSQRAPSARGRPPRAAPPPTAGAPALRARDHRPAGRLRPRRRAGVPRCLRRPRPSGGRGGRGRSTGGGARKYDRGRSDGRGGPGGGEVRGAAGSGADASRACARTERPDDGPPASAPSACIDGECAIVVGPGEAPSAARSASCSSAGAGG